ncbi:hypothetical protein Fmac_008048 [Flemingia macrophylla]|uniref:Myosin N-terminal SH3-like domain-containing protein n=1 Tax=Flemingia macrophylla TaxID=520843 RepID=A0ABD1MWC6_9FABA
MVVAGQLNFVVGSHVWIEDPEVAWMDGEIQESNKDEITVVYESGSRVVSKSANIYPKDPEFPPNGVEDMTRLAAYLHEPLVLQNLHVRYAINEIYFILEHKFLKACPDEMTACKRLLDRGNLQDYQIGKTEVFLRAGQMAELDACRAENFKGLLETWVYISRNTYATAVRIQTGMPGMAARNDLRFRKRTQASILIQIWLELYLGLNPQLRLGKLK